MFLHFITKSLIVITVFHLVQFCESRKCFATPVENDIPGKPKNMSEVRNETITSCKGGNDVFCFKSTRKGKGHFFSDRIKYAT